MSSRIDLLRRIVTILETVDDSHFNLTYWRLDSECGTACCAIGHAAADEVFQNEGLRMERWANNHYPTYGCFSDYFAVADLLKIKIDEAAYLFDPLKYEEAKDRMAVIDRLKHFIAERELT